MGWGRGERGRGAAGGKAATPQERRTSDVGMRSHSRLYRAFNVQTSTGKQTHGTHARRTLSRWYRPCACVALPRVSWHTAACSAASPPMRVFKGTMPLACGDGG